MSIKLMGQVWDYQFTKAEQSVMLAMADHAKDDGSDCYPSVDRIAWKTDYSDRQVRRVLHDLTRRGILTVVRKSGRNRPTEYKINLSKAEPKPEFRSKKADTMSAYSAKVDTMSTQNGAYRADTMSANSGKADTVSAHQSAIGGHLASNGRTFEGLKADIAMSPKPLTINPKVIDQYDSGFWLVCVNELSRTLPAGFVPTVTESSLVALGDAIDSRDGRLKPKYRIVVPSARAKGLDHFIRQAGEQIRRKLGSVLGTPVLVEIVAVTEPEMAVAA